MTIIKNTSLADVNIFHDAQVLLVEDSKINQQIISELLMLIGVRLVVANDAIEALEILQDNTFDAVLMDLQMPGMDGYEAVMLIREMPHCRDIPIIAMTANAGMAERQKCLKFGMNDHIVKSLDPGYLYQILGKWLARDDSVQSDMQGIESKPEWFQDFPLQLAGIDISEALENVGGSARLLKKLLLEFLQDHADDVDKIRQALDGGDEQQARRIAHTLHGISGSLGMSAMCSIVTALDNALSHQETIFYGPLVEGLEQPFNEVIRSIRTIEVMNEVETEGKYSDSPMTVDVDSSLVLVDAIAELIAEMSPDAESKAEELLSLLVATKERDSAILLVRQLSGFDFDVAQLTLVKLTRAIMAL